MSGPGGASPARWNQVGAFVRVETQGAGRCLDDLSRGAGRPALFDADDVVDRDAGEHGRLLPPQSHRAPASALRQAGRLWGDPVAPAAPRASPGPTSTATPAPGVSRKARRSSCVWRPSVRTGPRAPSPTAMGRCPGERLLVTGVWGWARRGAVSQRSMWSASAAFCARRCHAPPGVPRPAGGRPRQVRGRPVGRQRYMGGPPGGLRSRRRAAAAGAWGAGSRGPACPIRVGSPSGTSGWCPSRRPRRW